MLEIKLGILILCGLVNHVLIDVIKLKRCGKDASIVSYFRSQPYQTALSVVGCVAGFIVLESINELTMGTAYALGFGANVVAEKLGQKDINKVL